MAYFDNPDNYEWWQKELVFLREEREKRLNPESRTLERQREMEPEFDNELENHIEYNDQKKFEDEPEIKLHSEMPKTETPKKRELEREKISVDDLEKDVSLLKPTASAKQVTEVEKTGLSASADREPIRLAQLERDLNQMAKRMTKNTPVKTKQKQISAVTR